MDTLIDLLRTSAMWNEYTYKNCGELVAAARFAEIIDCLDVIQGHYAEIAIYEDKQ